MILTIAVSTPLVFASPVLYPFNIQWDGAQLLWSSVDGVIRWLLEYRFPETGETGIVADLTGNITTTELVSKFAGGRYVYVTIKGYDQQGNIIAYDEVGFYLSRHVDLTNSTIERLQWMLSDLIQSISNTINTSTQQVTQYVTYIYNSYQNFITQTFVPTNSPAFQNLQDTARQVIEKTPIGEISRETIEIKNQIDDIWSRWEDGLPSDAVKFQNLFTFDYGEWYGTNIKFEFPIAMYVQNDAMDYVWKIAEAIILISFVFLIIRRLGVSINV